MINNKKKLLKIKVVRDAISAIALCHNVTPMLNEDNKKVLQGSSPDELALVTAAEEFGLNLVHRDSRSITLQNVSGQIEEYKILANFPFSSETKRMGIILKHVQTDRIVFYLKGADEVLKDKVVKVQSPFIIDECSNLARDGLRTLVICQKYLTLSEYESWEKIYHNASVAQFNRNEKEQKAIESLESNMEFLCITGVEDTLQVLYFFFFIIKHIIKNYIIFLGKSC